MSLNAFEGFLDNVPCRKCQNPAGLRSHVKTASGHGGTLLSPGHVAFRLGGSCFVAIARGWAMAVQFLSSNAFRRFSRMYVQHYELGFGKQNRL